MSMRVVSLVVANIVMVRVLVLEFLKSCGRKVRVSLVETRGILRSSDKVFNGFVVGL